MSEREMFIDVPKEIAGNGFSGNGFAGNGMSPNFDFDFSKLNLEEIINQI